jgi:hypothetical protein
MIRLQSLVVVSLGLLFATANLFAQADSGTIVGVVRDQGGAVVQGATVTVVNEGTHLTRVVTSNDAGEYTVYSFPTGRLTIAAEHPGFQKLVRTGIVLTAADTLTVDLPLTVGNVQQTVEVTGEAPLLQSQTAAVSSLISNEQILETPLNGRAFTQLMPLSTGAAPTTSNMQATVGSGQRSNVAISVNGSVANNNTYLIDGFDNRDLWINYLIMVPTLDSIQEVRILASNYSAEYGAAAGATTVVQTKGGTNQFHGDAYEFLRNNAFDANNFFNNLNHVAKPPFHRNEFGATIGGPIRKDKTFFFGDYQGTRIVQPFTTVSAIPNLAQQAEIVTGNFGPTSTVLYNPYQTVSGSQTRVPFPNNQIPASLLDPLAAKLVSLLPTPNAAGANNYIINPPNIERDDQFDIRVDQNIGSSDRLFFKYSYFNMLGQTAGSLYPGPHPVVNVGEYLTGGGITPLQNWTAGLDYTKVVSATIVNEARLGVIRPHWGDTLATGEAAPIANELGIPNLNVNDRSGGLPAYVISGFQTIGQSAQTPDQNHTTSYQYEDTLTWVKGTHTLKFGARYLRHDFNGFSAIGPRGSFSFSGQFTRQAGASSGGSALADFALGAYYQASRSIQYGIFGMRMWETGFFAEDDWRVTNRLTLNYGLRHEMQSPPYEVNNQWANFDIHTGDWRVAGQDGNSRTLRNLYTHGFAPRIGIAYLLTADGKTVLRAGGGFFYVESFNMGKQLFQNPPLTVNQAISTDQNAPPPAIMSQGLPAPVVPNLNNPAAYSGTAFEYDPNFKPARSMQWSIGIQRELQKNLLFDVSWVGNRTLDLINSLNGNQAVPGPGTLNPRRPLYSVDPLLGDVDLRTNWGAAKYESMQTKLQKRYSKGLIGSFAWTWSHNEANAREPATSVRPENSYCTRCEWGNALEDRRHMVVINHVYELPFGSGRTYLSQGFLGKVVGGWNLSGTWIMYTGQWFAASLASPVSNTQSTGAALLTSATERPNWVSNPNVLPAGQTRSIYDWFNVAAFSVPAQYTFGNSGNGIILGPGYFNVDLGVHREFPIKERMKLTFRWEMFNSFNHTNFNNPNATIGSAPAGTISSSLPARSMQFAMKLVF